MKPPTCEPVDVLAILREEDYQAQFAEAPGEWRLRSASNYEEAEAQAILQEGSVEVIISDYRINDRHSWRDLLQKMPAEMSPPLVIVADRNADEHMWVEVLAEGGFDLLRKPLDRAEVGGVLSVACGGLRQPVSVPGGRTGAGEEESAPNKRAAAA